MRGRKEEEASPPDSSSLEVGSLGRLVYYRKQNYIIIYGGFSGGSVVKRIHLPMHEVQLQFLGQKIPWSRNWKSTHNLLYNFALCKKQA